MHTKIELQPKHEQHLARWEDLGADLELAKLPYKIEPRNRIAVVNEDLVRIEAIDQSGQHPTDN